MGPCVSCKGLHALACTHMQVHGAAHAAHAHTRTHSTRTRLATDAIARIQVPLQQRRKALVLLLRLRRARQLQLAVPLQELVRVVQHGVLKRALVAGAAGAAGAGRGRVAAGVAAAGAGVRAGCCCCCCRRLVGDLGAARCTGGCGRLAWLSGSHSSACARLASGGGARLGGQGAQRFLTHVRRQRRLRQRARERLHRAQLLLVELRLLLPNARLRGGVRRASAARISGASRVAFSGQAAGSPGAVQRPLPRDTAPLRATIARTTL